MPYIANLDWIRAGEYPDDVVLNRPLHQLLNNTDYLKNIIETQLLPLAQYKTGIYLWQIGFAVPYPVYVVGSDQKLYKLKVLGTPSTDPTVTPASWDGPYPFTDTYVIDSNTTTLGLAEVADSNKIRTNASGTQADLTYDPSVATAKFLPGTNIRSITLNNGANPSTYPNVFSSLKGAIDSIPQGGSGIITCQFSAGNIFIDNQVIEVVNKTVTIINNITNIARTDGRSGTIYIRNGKLTMLCGGTTVMAYRNSPPNKYRGLFTLAGNAVLEFKPSNYDNYFISPFTRTAVVTNKVSAFAGAPNDTNTPFLSVYGSNNTFVSCNANFTNYKTSGSIYAQFADIEPTHGSLSISNSGKGPLLLSQFVGFDTKSIPQNSSGLLYPPSQIGYNAAYFKYADTLATVPSNYVEAFPVRGGGVAASGALVDSHTTTYYYVPFNNCFGKLNYVATEKFPGINVFDFSCGGSVQRTIDSTGWNELITGPTEYSLDLSSVFVVKTPTAFSTDDNYLISVSNTYDGTANTNTVFSCYLSSTGVLKIQHDSGLNVPTTIVTTVTLSTNSEYHIVIVRDTVALDYKIYVDGTLVDTQVYLTNPTKGATPSQRVHILCDANIGTNINEYNMMPGSLIIYSQYKLSNTEITNLFEASSIIN